MRFILGLFDVHSSKLVLVESYRSMIQCGMWLDICTYVPCPMSDIVELILLVSTGNGQSWGGNRKTPRINLCVYMCLCECGFPESDFRLPPLVSVTFSHFHIWGVPLWIYPLRSQYVAMHLCPRGCFAAFGLVHCSIFSYVRQLQEWYATIDASGWNLNAQSWISSCMDIEGWGRCPYQLWIMTSWRLPTSQVRMCTDHKEIQTAQQEMSWG